MDRDALRDFMLTWSIKYPYDKRWREKHGIPLFSSQHLSMTLGDILLEEMEQRLYNKLVQELKGESTGEILTLKTTKYIPGENNWLTDSYSNITSAEEDELFNKIKF